MINKQISMSFKKKKNDKIHFQHCLWTPLVALHDDTATPKCRHSSCSHIAVVISLNASFTEFAPNVLCRFFVDKIFVDFRNCGSQFSSLFREEGVLLLSFLQNVNNNFHVLSRWHGPSPWHDFPSCSDLLLLISGFPALPCLLLIWCVSVPPAFYSWLMEAIEIRRWNPRTMNRGEGVTNMLSHTCTTHTQVTLRKTHVKVWKIQSQYSHFC